MGKESLAALDLRQEQRRTPVRWLLDCHPEAQAAEENAACVCVIGEKERLNAVPRQTSAVTPTVVQPESHAKTDGQSGSGERLMSYPILVRVS